jgi:LmbE family N-acetylglucosaminyl deacetylase
MIELAQELESRGMNFDAWGLKPDAFGVPLSTITTRLDIREYLNTKIDALNCHRTQFARDNVFIALPSDLAEEFLGWEFFVKANSSNTDQDKLAEIIGK